MILYIDMPGLGVKVRVQRERTLVVAINDERGSSLIGLPKPRWVRWPPSPPGTPHMVRYTVMIALSSPSAQPHRSKVQLGLAMRSVKGYRLHTKTEIGAMPLSSRGLEGYGSWYSYR